MAMSTCVRILLSYQYTTVLVDKTASSRIERYIIAPLLKKKGKKSSTDGRTNRFEHVVDMITPRL